MQNEDILRKSERGQREMAAATPTLSPKMRRLLIMADGRTTVAQLVRMVPGADGPGMLGELLAMGFLEVAGARAPERAAPPAPLPVPPAMATPAMATPAVPASPVAPERTAMPAVAAAPLLVAAAAARQPQLAVVSAAAPAPAGDPAAALAPLKAELRAYLTEVLGADIALVQDKLDAIQDRERLARFLAGCEDLVGNYGGARKAADFRHRFAGRY